ILITAIIFLYGEKYLLISETYNWNHNEDIVYVRPVVAGSGLVRNVDGVIGTGMKIQIVRGTVTFRPNAAVLRGAAADGDFNVPDELRYQFFLHKPDANGNDISLPISAVLTGQQNVSWSSTNVGDGVYAVSVRLYSSGTASNIDISRFRARPVIIIVDNDGVPQNGPQWIPITGYEGMRSRNYGGTGIDWVWYPGWSLPTANKYPYQFVPPPASDEERRQLANDNKWFTETWFGVLNARYDNEPAFARTEEGHVVAVGTNFYVANESKSDSRESFLTDGPRNQGGVMGPTTLIANPRGPGVLGATHGDRVFFAGPDGIFTVAGFVTKRDVLPCIIGDCSSEVLNSQKVWIGNFVNNEKFNFGKQSELVFDPENHNKIYISDTFNHRIALLEVNGCDENYQNCDAGYPRITTFAGQYGEAGFSDGDLNSARFNKPCGMTIIGRTLYVADRGNDAIRAIDLNNGVVRTVVGPGTFGSAPYIVRRTSKGNLVVKAGVPIYHLDLSTKTVRKITDGGKDDRMGMDVDWRGNFGPVDDIIFTGYKNDHGIARVSIDGSNRMLVVGDEGYPAYFKDSMGGGVGAYGLQVAIDDEEARLFITHTYRERISVLRPLKNSDPDDIDKDLAQRGKYILHYGTIWDFNQHWSRASLAAIFGPTGHHWLGNSIPTFDELAEWEDIQLAEYIQNGMAGHIKRPEITGKDLQALIYYIKVTSLKGKFEYIDPESIKKNLAGTSYWPDVTDTTPPDISKIVVVDQGNGTYEINWETNEPAIGLVVYGTNSATINYKGPIQKDVYGLFSNIEDGYFEQHTVILENVPSNQKMKFKIFSKDKAGNLAKTGEMTLEPGKPGDPPSAPRNLRLKP
ncbi:MAG: hypothetical protein D6813_15055, partial [Calditrichaeota bacterium]